MKCTFEFGKWPPPPPPPPPSLATCVASLWGCVRVNILHFKESLYFLTIFFGLTNDLLITSLTYIKTNHKTFFLVWFFLKFSIIFEFSWWCYFCQIFRSIFFLKLHYVAETYEIDNNKSLIYILWPVVRKIKDVDKVYFLYFFKS